MERRVTARNGESRAMFDACNDGGWLQSRTRSAVRAVPREAGLCRRREQGTGRRWATEIERLMASAIDRLSPGRLRAASELPRPQPQSQPQSQPTPSGHTLTIGALADSLREYTHTLSPTPSRPRRRTAE